MNHYREAGCRTLVNMGRVRVDVSPFLFGERSGDPSSSRGLTPLATVMRGVIGLAVGGALVTLLSLLLDSQL